MFCCSGHCGGGCVQVVERINVCGVGSSGVGHV